MNVLPSLSVAASPSSPWCSSSVRYRQLRCSPACMMRFLFVRWDFLSSECESKITHIKWQVARCSIPVVQKWGKQWTPCSQSSCVTRTSVRDWTRACLKLRVRIDARFTVRVKGWLVIIAGLNDTCWAIGSSLKWYCYTYSLLLSASEGLINRLIS